MVVVVVVGDCCTSKTPKLADIICAPKGRMNLPKRMFFLLVDGEHDDEMRTIKGFQGSSRRRGDLSPISSCFTRKSISMMTRLMKMTLVVIMVTNYKLPVPPVGSRGTGSPGLVPQDQHWLGPETLACLPAFYATLN